MFRFSDTLTVPLFYMDPWADPLPLGVMANLAGMWNAGIFVLKTIRSLEHSFP